jgi:hypothetical protein
MFWQLVSFSHNSKCTTYDSLRKSRYITLNGVVGEAREATPRPSQPPKKMLLSRIHVYVALRSCDDDHSDKGLGVL